MVVMVLMVRCGKRWWLYLRLTLGCRDVPLSGGCVHRALARQMRGAG